MEQQTMCPDCGTVFGYTVERGLDQTRMSCRPGNEGNLEPKVTNLATCDEGLFWYYITERYGIYLAKKTKPSPPWTQDPILQRYKFCNVFRIHDRTTRWLSRNFLNHPSLPLEADQHQRSLLAFNICWFRMFNRWETGELLGWQTDWDEPKVHRILSNAKFPVFTGAYIIHSDPGVEKVWSIIKVCTRLWQICMEDLHSASMRSVKDVWQLLQQADHVGPFMAYQMVLDMMYTPLLADAPDCLTWACTGPGALRGLRRLDPGASMRDSLDRMLDLTTRSAHELAKVGGSNVPPLNVHDIEFCLCELDKYCRVKYGEGRPRSSYAGV